MNELPKSIFEGFDRHLKDIGMSLSDVMKILKQDDWIFIIKIAAIMEKSLDHLICAEIDNAKVNRLVNRLSLAEKIDYAVEYGLLEAKDSNPLKTIGRLRNTAAHDIKFDFFEYLSDINKLNAFKTTFSPTWSEKLKLNGKKIDRNAFTAENPKLTLVFAMLGSLAMADLELQARQSRKGYEKNMKEILMKKELQKATFDGMRTVMEAYSKTLKR